MSDENTQSTPAGGSDDTAPMPPSDAPGAVPDGGSVPPHVDGYDVVELLGAGGMGTVWRARQHGTGRIVALKLLTERPRDTRGRARFVREVELASRLEHPNVARVYDSGVHAGSYYYAMELVEGVPLDHFVRTQRLKLPGILRLMRAVCDAVQHAHFKGIIHRDLKPSNVLVTPDGQPRVLDFGLARPITIGAQAMITQEGDGRAGTPAFMSPEQAAGRAGEVDTRSDVYSLGKMLFMVVLGRPAHDLSGGEYDVWRRVVDEDVRRPRDVDPSVPPDLEAVLLKALDRDPRNRYESAGALGKDLHNVLHGEPVSARPATVRYFLRKKMARHRPAMAAVGGFVAVLAALAVYAYVRIAAERDVARSERGRADVQRDVAVAARADAEAERGRAERAAANAVAVNEFVQHVLAALDPRNSRGLNNVARAMMEQADRALSTRFAGDARTEASIRVSVGRNLLAVGQFASAQDQLAKAVNLLAPSAAAAATTRPTGAATAPAAEYGPAAVEAMDLLAQVDRELGLVREAEVLADRAYAGALGLYGPADLRTLGVMNTQAYVWNDLGLHDRAQARCLAALQLAGVRAPQDLGSTPPPAAAILSLAATLDRFLRETGDPAKVDASVDWARQVYAARAAAARLARAGDPTNDFDSLEAQHDLASALNARARMLKTPAAWEEPLAQHRAVVGSGEAVLGKEHPDLLIWKNDLAVALSGHAAALKADGATSGADGRERAERELAEAEQIYQAILPAAALARGADHQYTVLILNGLAYVVGERNRPAEAIVYYRQLEAYARGAADRLGPENAQALGYLDALNTALNYQRRYADSDAVYVRALNARRALRGPAHRETLRTALYLAQLRLEDHRSEDARPLLIEALRECERSFPDNDPLTAEVRATMRRLPPLDSGKSNAAGAVPS